MDNDFMQQIYKEISALPPGVKADKRTVEILRMLEEMLKKNNKTA